MSVTVKDRMPQFSRSAKLVLDDALKEGAKDIIVSAKTKAPFQKGALRRDSDVKKISRLLWRVSFWAEYARYQEFGGDGRRTIRKYSTAGTGKGYLGSSGDEVAGRIVRKFKKHGRRAK